MTKPKHIPTRTCVACRATDEKRDLLRVVRQTDGSVCYDPRGKLSGRGAYVCANPACIALARKQKRLERSLKLAAIPEELFTQLSAQVPEGAA
ncbi:MAG TPA: YlxR family protein [Chthonomonadaceae bacterium]|nr:YlxR family protein [Chthonomonadaceae bacterium]